MKKSLLLVQVFISSVLFSLTSYASFIGIIVFDEEYYQGSKNEQCPMSGIQCAPIQQLRQSGDKASCVSPGNNNLKVTSSEQPGVQSLSFEYINGCGYSVQAKIRSGNSWSSPVSIPSGSRRWINISYSSYSDNPVEVMFGNPSNTDPQPNPNPNPGPNPGQPAPGPKPNPLPITSDRPGQCMPGMGNSNVPGHSVINLERRSVSESIPLVGANFYLNYSSDRFKKDTTFNSRLGTIGGWSLSIQHYLDVKNKILYYGDGRTRRITDELTYTDPSKRTIILGLDQGEAYNFNLDGRIAATWGSDGTTKIYSFQYEGEYLAKVTTDKNQSYTFSRFAFISPFGQKTDVTFDGNGNLTKLTNPNNESYSLTTEQSGRLITFQKPSGLKTAITYDVDGNLVKDQGAVNSLVLDSHFVAQKNALYVESKSSSGKFLGGIRVESNEVSTTVSHQNDFGSISSSYAGEKPLDVTKPQINAYSDIYGGTFSSQSFNNVTKSTFEIQNTSLSATYEVSKDTKYSKVGANTRMIQTTNVTFNNNPQRKFKVVTDNIPASSVSTSALGRVTKVVGNAFSKNISIQNGDLAPFEFALDQLGRPSNAKQGDRQQSFAYDNFGNLASTVDSQGRKTSFEYDKANRPVKQILSDGNAVEFAYDLDGNLKSIKPPGKPNHSFVTGIAGLVESYLPPSIQSKVTGATVYSYDQDKQITKISRPDGKSVEFTYAPDSFLLTGVSSTDGDYKIQYAPIKDGKSDLPGEILAPGGIKLSYNYVWKLPTAIKTSGEVTSSVAYSYNSDFSLGMISFAGGDGIPVANRITYDLDSLPVSVGDLKMTRNNVGLVSATSLGKVVEGIGFNTFGEPISSGFMIDKNPIFGMSYNRDKLGRVTASQDVTGTTKVASTYEYDSQGRLSKVVKGADSRSYTYDANGNRLGFTSGAKSYTGVYDEQDRLLSYGNSKFEYNDNGDLQTRTDVNPDTKEVKTTSYTYDVFGNLRKVVLPDGRVIEYVIDGQNRRIGKKINGKVVQAFIYQNQLQIAAEMDGSGKIVKSFVYGSKINVPDYVNFNGKQYRIISDQVGTPKVIVDSATGAVAESFNYDEFGVSLDGKTSAIIPFGFAGGLYDADTGLVRFGARDYSPVVGRWTNKDPIGFNGGQSNLYVYSANDPVNLIDPSGKFWTVAIGAVIGGVSGYYTTGGSASGIVIGVISGALSGTGIGSGALAGAGISAVANIATQVAGGISIWDINKESVLMSAASGFAGALIGNTVNLALPGNKFAEKILAPAIGGAFGAGADGALTNDFALGKTCP